MAELCAAPNAQKIAPSGLTWLLPPGTIKRLHVDQHKIKTNKKTGLYENVITIQWCGKAYKVKSAQIKGESRVVYSPDKALSCGAHVWVETRAAVVVSI